MNNKMIQPLLLIAFAITVVFMSVSCTSGKSSANTTSAVVLLRNQSNNWDQAIIRKRFSEIASNMSDDFRHIDKQGSISDKQTFLREIMSDDLVIHPYVVQDLDIRVYGTCALLCGTTLMTGMYQGKPFKSHYRYIDTYIQSNGAWKIVSVQISPIPQH